VAPAKRRLWRPVPAEEGEGRIVLPASASRAGTAWTDDGTARQERGLAELPGRCTRGDDKDLGEGFAETGPA
jgi:hypothetical protein